MTTIQSDPELLENGPYSSCSDNHGKSKSCQLDEQNYDPQSDKDCSNICSSDFAARKYYWDNSDPKNKKCFCGDIKESMSDKNNYSNDSSMNAGGIPAVDLQYYGQPIRSTNQFSCGSKEMVTPERPGSDNHIAPSNYFSPLSATNDNNTTRCGCDASMAQKWKCTTQGDDSKTISNAFIEAANTSGVTPDNLYGKFSKQLNSMIGLNPDGSGDQKAAVESLKGLIAHDVCRFYNVSQPRVSTGPSIDGTGKGDTPSNWIKYYFSKFDWAFKLIVSLMVIHIFLRTLIPKGGDYKNSLLYAMAIPKNLLSSRSAFAVIGGSIVVVIAIILGIMFSKNHGKAAQKALLKFYIPMSIKDLLFGGIAFSVYAVLFSIILGKAIGSGERTIMFFALLGVTAFWTIAWGGLNAAIKEQSWKDALHPQESPMNTGVFSLWLISALTLIGGLIMGSGAKKFGGWAVFVMASLIGIIPLAVFFILLNFAVTNLAPMAELALLVVYRVLGAAWSFNPKGPGSILLTIMGVRPTDKWVLPFLPWVTLPIRAYYHLTGETLPGYFDPKPTVTGVSNTDMWLS